MKESLKNCKTELILYGVLFLSILVFKFLFCFANVSGLSMYPTLNDKDYLLVLKTSDVDYGDIVIIKKRGYDNYLVKRVIAKSGDELEINSEGVSINSESPKEDYIHSEEDLVYANYSETVSNDSYFVMGDNRNHSGDSRVFGDVLEDEIVGVVVYNFSRFGLNRIRIHVMLFILIVVTILGFSSYMKEYRKTSKK